MSPFLRELRDAIKDFLEHGYSSEERLLMWTEAPEKRHGGKNRRGGFLPLRSAPANGGLRFGDWA